MVSQSQPPRPLALDWSSTRMDSGHQSLSEARVIELRIDFVAYKYLSSLSKMKSSRLTFVH